MLNLEAIAEQVSKVVENLSAKPVVAGDTVALAADKELKVVWY